MRKIDRRPPIHDPGLLLIPVRLLFVAKTVPELADVLKNGNFQEFAAHLDGLNAIYRISSDSKARSSAWVVLSALESDLATLAKMQDAFIPDTFSLVHKTPVGILIPRRGGA
jgi:mediator of RNA polymerase II transcription subunit 1